MQKFQPHTPVEGFGVHDALFVVFKRKWMIILFSTLGFCSAAAVYVSRTPIYQSEARLLVRYVRETGTVDPFAETKSPGGGGNAGDPVINTEIEILKGSDLALEVASAVGAEKLLAGTQGRSPATVTSAAAAILEGMGVSVGQSSNVLYVTCWNKDPGLPKVVLDKILELYFIKHLEIHRSAAAFDMVAKETESVRNRLKDTELKLNKLKADAGILSLKDASSDLSSQQAKVQDAVREAKADYAERQSSISALEKVSGSIDQSSPLEKIGNRSSNGRKISKTEDEPAPLQAISDYRKCVELLAFLQKRDIELRLKFKSGNRLLTINQLQIDTYEAQRHALVEKYPDLVAKAQVVENEATNPKLNLVVEKARLAAINTKIEVYEMQRKEISAQITQLIAVGAEIEEVDRRKQMEDIEYRSLEENLKNARINQTLDPSRMPNITVIQHPTEPIKYFDKKANKLIPALAGGGMGLGLGIAFMIELLFDRRIKRPIEIQTRLQLPLLMSIPYIRRKERGGFMLSHESEVSCIENSLDRGTQLPAPSESSRSTLGRANHFMLPYAEAIRDRVIFNFEINNLTHKPKFVAVTGLSEGAGASTIAAGLAKSFSEINGAKVLLVDLSSLHSDQSPLFGEIPRHSLSSALRLASNAKFKDGKQRLYYASATGRSDDGGLTRFSPIDLYELMPELQASDFDYIIFDMPPVDQISRTITMAGMMDKVLLVLDAENTSRDALMWGYSELIKGKADVSCIFNKTRLHTPGWLSGQN